MRKGMRKGNAIGTAVGIGVLLTGIAIPFIVKGGKKVVHNYKLKRVKHK